MFDREGALNCSVEPKPESVGFVGDGSVGDLVVNGILSSLVRSESFFAISNVANTGNLSVPGPPLTMLLLVVGSRGFGLPSRL